MKEINSHAIDPVIKKLLSYATAEHKVAQEYTKYILRSERKLYSFVLEGEIAGCVGVELSNINSDEIKHIAVLPVQRGNGIGRSMIQFICVQHSLSILYAETDHEAVGFYQHCGFNVQSLGEKYPGVERFECAYQHSFR